MKVGEGRFKRCVVETPDMISFNHPLELVVISSCAPLWSAMREIIAWLSAAPRQYIDRYRSRFPITVCRRELRREASLKLTPKIARSSK